MRKLTKIAVLGEVMLELRGAEARQNAYSLGFAGDSFNTAVHLARLGFSVRYLSALGIDRFSDDIVAGAEAEGLEMDHILRLQSFRPGLYLIENDHSGERYFHYWRDNSAARRFFVEESSAANAFSSVENCDALFLTGISLAVMGKTAPTAFWAFMDRVKESGIKVFYDPNYRPALWSSPDEALRWNQSIAPYCDTVFPTLADEQLLGKHLAEADVVRFYSSHGVREIVLKLPNATAMVWNAGFTTTETSDYDGEVVDTTGAGDAFNAGFMSVSLKGGKAQQALLAGHRSAATVISVTGAIPVEPGIEKECR